MPDVDLPLYRYLSIRPDSTAEVVLKLLVQTGVFVMGADEGSLLVYDPDANDLRFVMNTGADDEQQMIVGQRVPLGLGITGLAAATREVHIGAPTYKDVKQLERTADGEAKPEAVIAAPMALHDKLLGVLTAVSFKEGKRFTAQDARIYGSFAAIAALVIEQEQRLGRHERDASGVGSIHSGDDVEAQIASSLGRIARERPYLLGHIADILARTEKIAFGEHSE